MVSLLPCDSKLKVFGSWTKQNIWGRHFGPFTEKIIDKSVVNRTVSCRPKKKLFPRAQMIRFPPLFSCLQEHISEHTFHTVSINSDTMGEVCSWCVRKTSRAERTLLVLISLWERQKGEDKMIGQGAPPSPCKQGLDSSSCPESKHKYLFLLGVHWQRRWNQDTTPTANKQPPRADGRQRRPRGPQGSCVDVVLSTFPSWRPSSPIYASSLPSSSPLFSFLFFLSSSVWLDLPFQSVQLILPQRASILSWEEAASPAL